MAQQILEPTTTEASSEEFTVANQPASVSQGASHSMPAHVTAPGLAGVETAKIQKKNIAGTFDDYLEEGSTVQLDVDNLGISITSPGIYRVHKSSTAASVGVELSTEASP